MNLPGLLIRFRVPVIVLTILITLVFGYFLKDIRINADILSYLPKKDPVAKLNTYLSEEYGGSYIAVVAIEADDVFDPEIIESIHALTSEFQLIDGVQYVTSLTNVLDIKKVDDWLEIGKLIDPQDLPLSEERLSAIRLYTLGKDMYRGRLVSSDGEVTIIMCRLQEEADKAVIADQIRKIVNQSSDRFKPYSRIYFAGLPFQLTEISRIVMDDLIKLVPLAALLIMISLYLNFRSVRGVLLPLLSAGLSSVWALGIMSLLGISFSVITNVIPVVLLAVGSAYGIHVISMFNEEIKNEQDRRERSATALRKIALPVILAAVTTIVGFIAFIFGSYLIMIAEFGIFSALGILFALIISLSFIPSVLSLLPASKSRRKAPADASGTRKTVAERISETVIRRRRVFVTLASILVLASIVGFPRIRQEVDFISYFKPDTQIMLSERMMRERFGGSTTLEILVQGDIKAPEVLRKMKDTERFLENRLNLHNVHSVVELIEEMSFAMVDERVIPDTKDKVGNLWFLLEGEETLYQLVNEESTEAVIRATVESQNTREIAHVVSSIEDYIKGTNSDQLSMQLAGSASVYHRVSEGIKKSQIQSLFIALALVLLCNIFLLRSIAVGLIGLTPIVFSLFMLFGIMGTAGIPLDVATVLIGSISMGVGIDYSIHFLNRFRRELQTSGNRDGAVERTLKTTGKAIFINVVTVSAGLLTLVLGNLIPLRRFSLLILVTMLGSGLGALTLLPSILLISPARLLSVVARRQRAYRSRLKTSAQKETKGVAK
jgi:predicted RND superfamily exporter protein